MSFARFTGVSRTVACSFALLFIACSASAQDPKNAATWYGKSVAAWKQFKQNFPQQAELLTNYAGDSTAPITPEIRAALTNIQGVIGDFRKGSQQEYCDFALDYSQGFEMTLPHLSEMRGIAKAIRADAAVRLADGDSSGAAAELTSMYKSSGHFGDDHVLISSLVGQAVFAFADGGVQSALDSASFNAADAAALLAGAQQLGTDDPFAYVEAAGMEQEIAITTFEKYRGPDGLKALGEMLGSPEMAQQLSGLDDAGFEAELTKYDDMMTRVNGIFGMTDKDAATAEMKKLEGEIESGAFGVMAKVVAPAFGKVLERKFTGEQMIADRIATLSKLASGEQKPEEAANAALWYLRAIQMWEALPAATSQAILAFDPHNAAAAGTQPMLAALIDVQPIIDVLREASIKRRCNFASFVRHRGAPAVAPHYSPGMHELLRMLEIDAQRLLAAGDKDAAIDRLAIGLRASAHLGGDTNLAVCRTAHVHFNAIIELLEAKQKAQTLDVHSSNAAALADAAGRVSRKDPFGYLAALQKTRDDIVNRFNSNAAFKDAEDRQRWSEQSALIRGYNSDQTMFALVIIDEGNRRLAAKAPPPPPPVAGAAPAPVPEPDDITLPETIARLRGVFDPEAVQAVRNLYDELGPRIAADDWEIFLGREATPVAHLTEGLTRARGDLRRATKLLMLPEDVPAADAPAKPPSQE